MSGETGILSLGGVSIPDGARLEWAQARSVLSAESVIEFSDMSMEVQAGPTSATKRLIKLTCGGWMPPGLDGLSRTSTHSFSMEVLTGENTWTTTTLTVWIIERPSYADNPRAPGGGYTTWTMTLREA